MREGGEMHLLVVSNESGRRSYSARDWHNLLELEVKLCRELRDSEARQRFVSLVKLSIMRHIISGGTMR